MVEGVEALDDRCKEHDESEHGPDVYRGEKVVEGRVPT